MDTPYIKLIEHSQEASQQAIIFIRGYISENLDIKIEKNWINSVRESGFKGAIYYLWWDSGKSTLGNYIRVNLRWNQVKQRAKKVGQQYLMSLISNLSEKSISLIGYSLGCRIIYYGLSTSHNHEKSIDNVILLGGAVRRNKNWLTVTNQIKSNLVNIYNSNDKILKVLFKLGDFNTNSPCGLKCIENINSKIVNIDATSLINSSSHSESKYLQILSSKLRHFLH